jgi:glycerophosphoryl diester phosphodiesterase
VAGEQRLLGVDRLRGCLRAGLPVPPDASSVNARSVSPRYTSSTAVSPWKQYIVSVAGVDNNHDGQADDVNGDGVVDDSDRNVLPTTTLIRDAHAVGLLVHTWRFRNERQFLGRQYGENPSKEHLQFYCLGIDGLFSDFPDTPTRSRPDRHSAICSS